MHVIAGNHIVQHIDVVPTSGFTESMYIILAIDFKLQQEPPFLAPMGNMKAAVTNLPDPTSTHRKTIPLAPSRNKPPAEHPHNEINITLGKNRQLPTLNTENSIKN